MTIDEPTAEQREKWELAQIKQSNSRLFARPIRSVIRSLLIEKGYATVQSVQQLADAWPIAVGATLAECTRPGKLSNGVLLVEVDNSQALQEIHFQKSKILKALQVELPAYNLSDLRFRIVSR